MANTHPIQSFAGFVLVDRDINATPRTMKVAYSNRGTAGMATVQLAPAAALPVALQPSEVQVFVPAWRVIWLRGL